MEVAGTILGVLSLFNTALQLFEHASAYSTLGEDFQILVTRVRTEKIVLRAWGNGVGIENLGLRGDEEGWRGETVQNLRETLESMVWCFGRCEKLVKMYCGRPSRPTSRPGLRSLHSSFSPESDSTPKPSRRSTRLILLQSFKASSSKHQKSTTMRQRLRWVVHDRSRLKNYVSTLKDLNENLSRLITPNPSLRLHSINLEIDSIVDINLLDRLSVDLEHKDVAAIAAERSCELSCRASERTGFTSFESLGSWGSDQRFFSSPEFMVLEEEKKDEHPSSENGETASIWDDSLPTYVANTREASLYEQPYQASDDQEDEIANEKQEVGLALESINGALENLAIEAMQEERRERVRSLLGVIQKVWPQVWARREVGVVNEG